MNQNRRTIKYIITALLIVLVICIGAGVRWVMNTYQPNKEALAALVTDDAVTVTRNEWIVFEPVQQAKTGLIFYPGGLVEPEAYAPLCRKIAEEGYLVAIVPMKINLAVLSPNRADDVIKAYPGIKNWAIGGHSLGGVMAASYAGKTDQIKGVVLYAAYPSKDQLKDKNLAVLSIYGSLDGVADLNKVTQAELPEGALQVEIAGGNHCYFGSYGMQKGDHAATISNEKQIEEAAGETILMLQEMSE